VEFRLPLSTSCTRASAIHPEASIATGNLKTRDNPITISNRSRNVVLVKQFSALGFYLHLNPSTITVFCEHQCRDSEHITCIDLSSMLVHPSLLMTLLCCLRCAKCRCSRTGVFGPACGSARDYPIPSPTLNQLRDITHLSGVEC